MKKILTTACILVSCVSVAYGADNSETLKTESPNARIFLGGNIGMNINSWSNDVKSVMGDIGVTMPYTNFALGAEIGVKFLPYENMYNIAINAEYKYMFDSGTEINYPASEGINEITVGFSSLGFNIENYFRISNTNNKRFDLIAGVGYTQITERATIEYKYLPDDKGKDKGSSIALTFGAEGQITDHISLIFKPRIYFMTAKDSDLDTMFDINAGIRYTF